MRHRHRSASSLLALFVLLASPARAAPRIGDPGSVYDPAKDDAAFPNMKEWAKAGVEGGVPARDATPVRATLLPGQDIQAAIDGAEAPGVVLLAAGVHPIQNLELKSGIILRGVDRSTTVLEVQEDGTDFIRMNGVERAALEDLTIRHRLVAGLDPASYYCKYENEQSEIEALTELRPNQQNTIKLSKVKNCWIQNCIVEKNISRVLRIDAQSSHVTLRDNVWDTSLYKGGGGQAYYELVDETSYVLMYNETLKDIRHLALDYGAHHNVLIHSALEVDVNWHVGTPEHDNLVEGLDSTGVPACHFWGAFSHYLDPVGPGNLIYRSKPDYDDGRVYLVFWPGAAQDTGAPFIQAMDGPAPQHGTLYPVTGEHRPPEQSGAPNPEVQAAGSGGETAVGAGGVATGGASGQPALPVAGATSVHVNPATDATGPDATGGCACRAAPDSGSSRSGLGLLAAALLAFSRRLPLARARR